MRRAGSILVTAMTISLVYASPVAAQFPGRNGRFADTVGDDLVTWPRKGGSSKTIITMAGAEYPSWTPNGRAIVFDSNADGDTEIYRVRASGGGARQLTDNSRQDWGPHQGPDRRIVYVCDRAKSEEICTIRTDGTGRRRLTNNGAEDWNPKWSPNGDLIVFSSTRRGGDHDIWVMRADGKRRRQLTDGEGNELEPDFSPNGNRIVYWDDSKGVGRLFMIRADGTNRRRLSPPGLPDRPRTPSWAPNGKRIAFATGAQLRTIRPNGTRMRTIVASGVGENISWQPRP